MEKRRDFLKKAVLTASLLSVPADLLAKSDKTKPLNLYVPKINKSFHPKILTESGHYDVTGMFELDKAMMDYRAYQIARTDYRLVNLLYRIQKHIGFNRKINILSGYRSPTTNNYLRHHTYGVAKHSYHMKAMAVDVHIDGMRLHRAKDLIRGINHSGGVGYYPNSGFIHTDVGPKRNWTTLA